MVSKLLFDDRNHVSQHDPNDPFYSIDFGSPSVKGSDGGQTKFVNISDSNHDPNKGINIKADSVASFQLVDPEFAKIYTSSITSLLVAIQFSNWQNPGNEGIWQLLSNWPLDIAESSSVDPMNLVMSLNPRDPNQGNKPFMQYLADSNHDPVKHYFVQFYGSDPLTLNNDYHWVYVYLNFETAKMQISENDKDDTGGFSTILLPYQNWENPTANNIYIVPHPVTRHGFTPNCFRLRKGSDNCWVKRVRIFKNLQNDTCLTTAWNRTKDLT